MRHFHAVSRERGGCFRWRTWADWTTNMFVVEFPTTTAVATEDVTIMNATEPVTLNWLPAVQITCGGRGEKIEPPKGRYSVRNPS